MKLPEAVRCGTRSGMQLVEKLTADAFGKNPKKNPSIGDLAKSFETAETNECHLNQDPEKAIGRLTSNIAKTVRLIIDGY